MIPSIYESVSWKPWGNSDQDLAGWITEYNYLTFVVIRGAGHVKNYLIFYRWFLKIKDRMVSKCLTTLFTIKVLIKSELILQ